MKFRRLRSPLLYHFPEKKVEALWFVKGRKEVHGSRLRYSEVRRGFETPKLHIKKKQPYDILKRSLTHSVFYEDRAIITSPNLMRIGMRKRYQQHEKINKKTIRERDKRDTKKTKKGYFLHISLYHVATVQSGVDKWPANCSRHS